MSMSRMRARDPKGLEAVCAIDDLLAIRSLGNQLWTSKIARIILREQALNEGLAVS